MSELRTFGGWRERRGFGVAGLSGTQTGGALLAVIGTLIVALLQPAVLTWIAFPLCAVFALVLVRVRGESLAGLIDKRVRLRVSGGVRRTSWDAPMPGMLEGLRVIEATDADGRQVGLVWMPGESLTALVPVEPLGTELVADAEVEAWMQGWSDWLAHLGYAAEVERVAVTVASGPTPVLPAQPTSDQLAAAVVTDLSAVARHMRSKTVVSLTLAAPDSSEVTARCAAVLELVGAGGVLARCGMSVLPAMSAEDVSLWVRQAFDPWLPEGPTTPADMRPTAVEERWATYRHDSAVSACYAWQEPPGEVVAPQTLVRLLGPAAYPKRVSVVYTPVPAHIAAREVDRQAEAALFRKEYRRRLGRDETARDQVDLQRARRTAQEQATGAGVVDVCMYVAVSATGDEGIAPVTADLDSRAGESRVRLRRSYGAQAEVFAATLGLGLVPRRRW